MLPKFRVNLDEATMVPGDDLKSVTAAVLQKMGVPRDDAALGADVLVLADLRGVDSHGVSNMLRSYVNGYTSGQINPNPQMTIVRETPATASIDSDRGLGIITTPKAMDIAIEKAAAVGIGMVTLGNARHLGMASYHAMLALEHDMIGVCMTSCPPSVVPTFGAEPRLGTNPIAIAVPSRHEAPFVFDAATSTVAGNKVGIARRLGVKLEPGWLADSEGTPIMEGNRRPRQLHLANPGQHPRTGFPQGLRPVVHGGHPGRRPHRFWLRSRAGPSQLRALRRRLQRGRLRRPGALQGHHGRVAPHDEKHPPRSGRRTGNGGRPARGRNGDHPSRGGHPLHQEVVDWFHDTCGELGIDCPF